MSQAELLNRFLDCVSYKRARPWQKPLLNPRRFVLNQMQKYRLLPSNLGELRVTSTFHLPEFTIVTGEAVSEQIRSYGVYEESLTEAFLHLVKPRQVVVDIGMHVGYYASLFACLVGEEGKVHAFEPTPSTREIAQRNLRGFSQVTVHPQAVWSSIETLAFRDFGVKWMAFNSFTAAKMDLDLPPPHVIEVKTITLDSFRSTLGRTVSLVKIDAESAEEAILKGAGNFLRQDLPLLSIEVGDSGRERSSRRLIDRLCSLNYSPWQMDSGKFSPHQPRECYVYDNLIFAPSEQDLSQS